jgi:hypothetical protein
MYVTLQKSSIVFCYKTIQYIYTRAPSQCEALCDVRPREGEKERERERERKREKEREREIEKKKL